MKITIYYQKPVWIVKTSSGTARFKTEQEALKYARNLIGKG